MGRRTEREGRRADGGRSFRVDGQYGSNYNIGGNQINFHGDDDAYRLEQFRRSSPLVKTLIVLGFLFCVGGLGIFGYSAFTHNPQPGDPDFASTPPGIALAAAVFFGGFVLAAVGSLAMALGGRRER